LKSSIKLNKTNWNEKLQMSSNNLIPCNPNNLLKNQIPFVTIKQFGHIIMSQHSKYYAYILYTDISDKYL